MAADSDITLFYKDAGVEQYSSLLVEQGFDSLPTLLSMNEAGLQDLKTAVNMKPGHLAALRAKIGREAPAGAPLREAEAQATAPAAPAPEPTLAPAARPVQHPYVPAAGDAIAAMALKFESKYSQDRYGNCMETYTSAKDGSKLNESPT